MTDRRTGVLQVGGVGWASSAPVMQAVLGRRPGVLDVAANPVAQTATVVYDGDRTSIGELRGWIESCGYHCAGQSVPGHLCDPLAEPAAAGAADRQPDDGDPDNELSGDGAASDQAGADADPVGHGSHGGHAGMTGGMSAGAMVRDMRN